MKNIIDFIKERILAIYIVVEFILLLLVVIANIGGINVNPSIFTLIALGFGTVLPLLFNSSLFDKAIITAFNGLMFIKVLLDMILNQNITAPLFLLLAFITLSIKAFYKMYENKKALLIIGLISIVLAVGALFLYKLFTNDFAILSVETGLVLFNLISSIFTLKTTDNLNLKPSYFFLTVGLVFYFIERASFIATQYAININDGIMDMLRLMTYSLFVPSIMMITVSIIKFEVKIKE